MAFHNCDSTTDRIDRNEIQPARQGVKIATQTTLLTVTTHNLRRKRTLLIS